MLHFGSHSSDDAAGGCSSKRVAATHHRTHASCMGSKPCLRRGKQDDGSAMGRSRHWTRRVDVPVGRLHLVGAPYTSGPMGGHDPLLLDVDGPSHLWVDRHRGLLSLGAQPFNPNLSVRFSTSQVSKGPPTTTSGGRRAFSSRFWGGVYLCQALGTMLEKCSLYIPRIGLVGVDSDGSACQPPW